MSAIAFGRHDTLKVGKKLQPSIQAGTQIGKAATTRL